MSVHLRKSNWAVENYAKHVPSHTEFPPTFGFSFGSILTQHEIEHRKEKFYKLSHKASCFHQRSSGVLQ